MITANVSEQLFGTLLDSPLNVLVLVNVWELFIPYAIFVLFLFALFAIYAWSEDAVLPAVLFLLYIGVANIPMIPQSLRNVMFPQFGSQIGYILIALALTGLFVNLFIRNRGY